MNLPASQLATLSLMGLGACVWGTLARPLGDQSFLQIPSNPLGIKKSPYGEVFAMAMQEPIEVAWHEGESAGHHHAPGETCHHDHDGCCEDHAHEAEKPNTAKPAGWLDRIQIAVGTRTNPKSSTQAHRLEIRRQIESKLRFAYELDPSHYGNYNAYHFFLTEPQLGTRPRLTSEAAKLAEQTISYCLSHKDDPRPSLTAASAVENILQLMFNEPALYSIEDMRRNLHLLDHCLTEHHRITQEWVDQGLWEHLSPLRREEIAQRLQFITRVRDAAEATIDRLAQPPHTANLTTP